MHGGMEGCAVMAWCTLLDLVEQSGLLVPDRWTMGRSVASTHEGRAAEQASHHQWVEQLLSFCAAVFVCMAVADQFLTEVRVDLRLRSNMNSSATASLQTSGSM